MIEEIFEVIINEKASGKRLDKYLVEQLQDFSRARIQDLINQGQVLVNQKTVKSNYKLKEQDSVEVTIPKPEQLEVKPQQIDLDILFEDRDIIVINKPQGMVVHPAAGNHDNTLVNALLYHCESLSKVNDPLRPGIVHRLDKDTSGVLVAAKNDWAHHNLAKQIKNYSVKRIYYALVHGVLHEPAGIVEAPIGRDPKNRKKMAVVLSGKEAVTKYWVVKTYQNYSLLKLQLHTGRTHQIRVHMSFLGHPVVGDPTYGPSKSHFGLQGQALHATLLGFCHPRTGKYMEFTAPLPKLMEQILKNLSKE